MIKIFYRFFILVLIVLLSAVGYISTIGVSTNIFNSNITQEIKKIDENLDINLKKVLIILNPIQFKINLKTVGTIIKYNEEKIFLENIKSDISLKSLLYREFSLTKINVSTKSLEIKNLIKFLRLFQKDPKIYIAEQVIKKGYLIADIKIEFDENGKVKDNFQINGLVKDGKINFFRKYNLEGINFIFKSKNNRFQLNDLDLKIENKNIQFPETVIIKRNNEYSVSGKLINKQINLTKEKFYDYFKLQNSNFEIKEIKFSSENNFDFIINNKFKIKDLNINSKIDLINLDIENNLDLKSLFPDIENLISLKNHKLQINYKKDNLNISGSGNIFFQKKADNIKYKIFKNNNNLDFDTKLDIKDNVFILDFLNYKKKNKSDLIIEVKGEHKINKGILFKKINLVEYENVISINDLSLSNFNKINYIRNINLNYQDENKFQNNIQITKKDNNYFINGSSLNINRLVDNLIDSDNKKNEDLFNNNFKVIVDIKKIYLDKKNILKNLNGYLNFKRGKVLEAELSSYFLNKKNIKFTIKSNDGEKTTTLFSNEAKPLVDRYKFIKGFDEGSLDFYSIESKTKTSSTLKIYDFKLKELPALTKLLTLASLQGIADLLSGEGIRFNEFEMNFSNKGDLMTIEEIYAIGPAISILMSGYVEKDKLISLRGTLVPATTLNKTIGSIPVLGNILVGKKVGEGVFGVSFKIKGPPNNLETTVNPIKTLTPRFITRTLEKIKKN